MTKLNEDSWFFWLKMSHWNHLEAAIILDGDIPSKKFFIELENQKKDAAEAKFSRSKVINDSQIESLLKILKRNFESTKINPADCLSWAEQIGIVLDSQLKNEAKKLDLLRPREKVKLKSSDSRGDHWIDMRNKILIRALYLINKPPLGFNPLLKKSGEINITKLSRAVADYGHELEFKNGKSISSDTIYDVLKEAIKGPAKKKNLGSRN